MDEQTISLIVSLSEALDGLSGLDSDMNVFWLLFGAILVFFMQTGFAMLEVGSVSSKNTKNILIKNIFDASIGAVSFWLLGYGFAFGEDSGGFIGTDAFAFSTDRWDDGAEYASWLFQWAFAATAATIVSGAVAERVSFKGYLIYATVLTVFVYPIVVHWGWSAEGWATAWTEDPDILLFDCGVVDFAGSGVVHMTGGCAALVAAIAVGPRLGRFNPDGSVNDLPQQSAVLQTLGTLILWFGWFGFNGVSTLAISGLAGVAARTMVTTAIAAASGALTTVTLGKILTGIIDIGLANNGILAGLVSITAPCSTCTGEGAFIIGIIGGLVYYGASTMLKKLKIDDVVDAAPVHMFCGMWGVLAAGLFATEDGYASAYYSDRADKCCGAFYGCGGKTFGANFVFIIAVACWTLSLSLILFYGIKFTVGLRVPKEMEEAGMDISKHGGTVFELGREQKPPQRSNSSSRVVPVDVKPKSDPDAVVAASSSV
mmetsp:Transcript_23009/g.33385  ORF Transcript_23009/g.33385 Transcript_23009/m.33385 type:complete len:486 (-) Transcript_23009:187-1644(-)|eukprot:CAMPEP_0113943514 /NCGR_PEP_ID=MMETSP1339-20121228/25474_1 /TAXON_ID=94617 /ORGANISM="Fibrocapsa japonica" /LENGTH=485 /DNA_ID=CAMNT_0000948413 /DNA_START=104 /DNA_END=1561 /DNA_ORIENTATION=+ /assembly_acc=CAM_ASM_000762